MLLEEPLLVFKSERNGKHHEQFLHDLLVHVFRERLDGGPVLPDDIGMRPVGMLGDELGDIVDLEVVFDSRQ